MEELQRWISAKIKGKPRATRDHPCLTACGAPFLRWRWRATFRHFPGAFLPVCGRGPVQATTHAWHIKGASALSESMPAPRLLRSAALRTRTTSYPSCPSSLSSPSSRLSCLCPYWPWRHILPASSAEAPVIEQSAARLSCEKSTRLASICGVYPNTRIPKSKFQITVRVRHVCLRIGQANRRTPLHRAHNTRRLRRSRS